MKRNRKYRFTGAINYQIKHDEVVARKRLNGNALEILAKGTKF